jgi:ADP-ribosyl-[dinitrogen reductase] hydrolase
MIHRFVSEIPNPPSNEVDGILLDRITGAMVGLALGDTLGAPVQFRTREYLMKNPVRGLSAGGPWSLQKGQVT